MASCGTDRTDHAFGNASARLELDRRRSTTTGPRLCGSGRGACIYEMTNLRMQVSVCCSLDIRCLMLPPPFRARFRESAECARKRLRHRRLAPLSHYYPSTGCRRLIRSLATRSHGSRWPLQRLSWPASECTPSILTTSDATIQHSDEHCVCSLLPALSKHSSDTPTQ